MKKFFLSRLILITAILIPAVESYSQSPANTDIRLYALDGGHLYFKNMGIFYDTGEHENEPGEMAVPCYLIKHGKDWLLWDTGNGDAIASQPAGVKKLGIQFTVNKTLVSQLKQLGLKPSDIRYVALSHLHPDHSGNIALFPTANFLISKNEMKWAFSLPTPSSVQRKLIEPLKSAKVITLEGDTDLFGDGSLRIIRTPGHTPGHQSLLLKLAGAGNVMITGDLYHTKETYEKKLVDAGNYSRSDELASFDRFDKLVRNLKARVILQHSPEDFSTLPLFPKYLE
ncbi:N-acyl homoserine lactonase family protein [Mucilaginibacter litoreus]|uniref:N-acyl homoserine lactonase family protein n=1 Tax=Mucilaginibacter litoreus TaxID=1048221 RepID=A0ABW3AYE7_9SPHI